MKNDKFNKLLKEKISFTILFLLPVFVWSETFRVNKVHVAETEQISGFETSVKMGVNDALAITVPKERIFMEGLELKMEIPEIVASWADCVACSVYAEINPEPDLNQIDYSGTRVFVQTLPGKLSWILQIPIAEENSLKASKYIAKIDDVVFPENDKIFLRLQPVMKGVPEEIFSATILVTIKPVLIDKGLLNLKLTPPRSQEKLLPHSVYIDEIAVAANENLILNTGIHNISVISEAYRNETRTVRIDQAKIVELAIEMKSIEPTLLITAPEGAKILFDDAEFTQVGTEVAITEGEHKLNFSIGSYEVIRAITAIKGKTYAIKFLVDLEVTEE